MDLDFGPLMSSFLISTIGGGFFMFGKKASRPIILILGCLMCVYPYFITSVPLLWLIEACLLIAAYFFRNS